MSARTLAIGVVMIAAAALGYVMFIGLPRLTSRANASVALSALRR